MPVITQPYSYRMSSSSRHYSVVEKGQRQEVYRYSGYNGNDKVVVNTINHNTSYKYTNQVYYVPRMVDGLSTAKASTVYGP